jgi:hypothetical protein
MLLFGAIASLFFIRCNTAGDALPTPSVKTDSVHVSNFTMNQKLEVVKFDNVAYSLIITKEEDFATLNFSGIYEKAVFAGEDSKQSITIQYTQFSTDSILFTFTKYIGDGGVEQEKRLVKSTTPSVSTNALTGFTLQNLLSGNWWATLLQWLGIIVGILLSLSTFLQSIMKLIPTSSPVSGILTQIMAWLQKIVDLLTGFIPDNRLGGGVH